MTDGGSIVSGRLRTVAEVDLFSCYLRINVYD